MLRNDYSWTDVALSFGATLLLAVMAVTSLALRYVTRPIACWMPAHFTSSMKEYTEEVCYRQEEIVFPILEVIPDTGISNLAQPTYHLWVPFALGIGALICLVPHIAWRVFSGPLLLDTHALLSSVEDNQRQAADRRHVLLRDTAILVQSTFKRGNSSLTVAALFRKLLACVTCLVQIILVVVLFRPQLGATSTDEDGDEENDEDILLPRNGSLPLPYGPFVCHVQVRILRTVHEYALQCVLPISQVYSKVFTFLFYVFLLLALLCTLDLLLWAGRLLIPGPRDVALQRYLDAVSGGDADGTVAQLYPRFSQWLGADGRLLLALATDHCGPLAAADLTSHLWTLYKAGARPGPVAFPGSSSPAATSLGGVSTGAHAGGDGAFIPLMSVGGKSQQ